MKKVMGWIIRLTAFGILVGFIVNCAIAYFSDGLVTIDRTSVLINMVIAAIILAVLVYIDYLIRKYAYHEDDSITNYNINLGTHINNKIPQLFIDYDSGIIDEKAFIEQYVKRYIKKGTPEFYTDHTAYLWFYHQMKWDDLSDEVRKLILRGQMNFLADEPED